MGRELIKNDSKQNKQQKQQKEVKSKAQPRTIKQDIVKERN